jgi:threonine aldolase
LGAPVGSALAGPKDLIKKARRHRKLFGGGMRQAGVLAAAALYALDHHIYRLAEDHANARRLAVAIRGTNGVKLIGDTVDTNILFFHVEPSLGTAEEFCARLKDRGLLMLALGPQQVRAVTHLDVSEADTIRAGQILAEVAERTPRTKVKAGQGTTYA